jgi:deoxyadenosine/deoxycytidine kinase
MSSSDSTGSEEDSSELDDPTNTDVRLNFIGDIHYISKASPFDYLLKTCDVIFVELPEEDIGNSRLEDIKQGIRDFYKMGGVAKAVFYMYMTLERLLFGRRSLAWTVLNKYEDKLVGIDSSEGRDMFFESSKDYTIKTLLIMAVFISFPRFIIRAFMQQMAIENGEKSSDDEIYADEADFSLGDNENESKDESNEMREVHMAEEIVNHLEDNPELNDVVIVVGQAHLESVIKKVDERNPNYTIDIANDYIVSEYLQNRD